MLRRNKRLALAFALLAAAAAPAQLRHPRPSALAARAGAALPIETTLGAALERAQREGRQVFWYVPTLRASPMDRTEVLDHYVRAGFFSDPLCTGALERFVVLRRVPDAREERRYGLAPLRFVEPGFLVLDAQGTELRREHGITTFCAEWLLDRLGVAESDVALPEAEKRILSLLREGRPAAVLDADAATPHARFLRGAALLRLGRHREARAQWQALVEEAPEHPQAARAAAELEGFGPLARGFWRFEALPADWRDGATGTQRPRDEGDLALVRERCLEFLLWMQQEDGGFRDSNYDFGGLDSLPNVHVAVTALAGMALLRAGQHVPASEAERLEAAWRRALFYVLDDVHVAPEDDDEFVWARIYGLQFVTRVLELETLPPGLPARAVLAGEAERFARECFARQGQSGAFRHEYENPFVTASVLLALHELERLGLAVPDASAAVRALASCRTPEGAFSYAMTAPGRTPRSALAAAAGRMPLCEAALLVWGRSDPERLRAALRTSLAQQRWLDEVRKYDDHAGRYRLGGFFYFYDQLGRVLALRQLGRDAQPFFDRVRAQILGIAEIDGTFVDSHELGRSYGTAMALLCLCGG